VERFASWPRLLKGSRRIDASRDGRVRLEAQASEFTGDALPPAPIVISPAQEIFVFPAFMPVVRVVSIGGLCLPVQPTADPLTPDVTLPINFHKSGGGRR
jgi:hypothetical protein